MSKDRTQISSLGLAWPEIMFLTVRLLVVDKFTNFRISCRLTLDKLKISSMSKDSTKISSPGLIHDVRPYFAETGFISSTLPRKHNFLPRHVSRCRKRSLNAVRAIISLNHRTAFLTTIAIRIRVSLNIAIRLASNVATTIYLPKLEHAIIIRYSIPISSGATGLRVRY
jgi:hypothetical protein